MGRQMPTECLHGYVIDPGDFDAKVEKCPHCERAENFSYDTRCAGLADIFLSEDAPADIPNDVYAGHVERLAQEIQDVIEGFCSYDDRWQKVKINEKAPVGHRISEAGPDKSGPEPVPRGQETK